MGLHIKMALNQTAITFRDEMIAKCDDSSAPPIDIDLDGPIEIYDSDDDCEDTTSKKSRNFLIVERELEEKREMHRFLLAEARSSLNMLIDHETTLKQLKKAL